MKYKEKLYTYHIRNQQDHTTKGVTLRHFGQTTL